MSSLQTTARSAALAALLSAGLACPALADGPRVIFVDDDAPAGGDGTNWDNAYRHLQDALDEAGTSPIEIRVAGGVYTPDRTAADPLGSGDRLATFLLRDNVTIAGGYVGLASDAHAERDRRDLDAHASVLTGDLLGDDDLDGPWVANNGFDTKAENSYHVIESWYNDNSAVVDGFVISGGNANRPLSEDWWQTRRDDSGGGAKLVVSDAIFRDCLFTDNRADANAHVLFPLTGPFGYVEAGGGAMFITRGAPTIESCVFDQNRANRIGGAVGLHHSAARISNCDFTGNVVGSPDFGDSSSGGALGDLSADFSTPERAVIDSCRFINNTTIGGYAGGVFIIISDAIYTNCLILANHADSAGGVLADNAAFIEFYNCAIIGNTSDRDAAGLHEISEVGDDYQFYNCIFWGNRSGELFELRNENFISDNGNVAIYDTIIERSSTHPVFAYAISRMLDVDPLFQDGTGPDGIPFSGDENLRLSPNSPAIDAGGSAALPAWLTTDLDGGPRAIDVPGVPNSGVGPVPFIDIGPYETPANCSLADIAPPFGVINFFDISAFIDLYNDGDPFADLAAPFGILNFFDVVEYINQYTMGCP